MNSKVCWRNWSWSSLRFYYKFYLEGLSVTTKSLNQDVQYTGLDIKSLPLDCEETTVPTLRRHSFLGWDVFDEDSNVEVSHNINLKNKFFNRSVCCSIFLSHPLPPSNHPLVLCYTFSFFPPFPPLTQLSPLLFFLKCMQIVVIL
jgi:hypothetical protein